MSNTNPLQLLRSSTANKRPLPAGLVDGRPAINTNSASPGLFFKDSTGGLVKVGPVHVGTTAPNVSPASGGATGNSVGEQWLDTTGGTYVLKIWDGSAWRSESGTFVDVNGDVMTGALVMDNQQQVRFRETTANGTNYIALQAPASVASDKTITLPDVDGTVVTTGDTGTVTSTMILNGTIVDADVNASAAIAGTKISPDFGSRTVQTTGVFSTALGTAGAPTFTFTGDLNTGIYSPGADQVAISTGGSGRLFVDASGRVGVGSAPSVGNGIHATINANNYETALVLQNANVNGWAAEMQFLGITTTDTQAKIGALATGPGSNSGALAFYTANAGSYLERLRITSAGLVGIGTSSPSTTLEIQNSTTPRLRIGDGIRHFEIHGGSSTQNVALGTAYNSGFDFFINGFTNPKMTLDASGRLGIGTTSPVALLQTNGTVSITGGSGASSANGLHLYFDTATNSGTITAFHSGVDNRNLTLDGKTIGFTIAGTERARIDSSGRLLVGTSTARSNFLGSNSAAFQVEGNLGVGSVGQIISHVYGELDALGGPYLVLGKHRSGSIGGTTLVANNDQLGAVAFTGADGTNFLEGARIQAFVDGTPGANDMPGRLVFSTTADGASSPTERLRITSAGFVGIGTSAPGAQTESRITGGGAAPATSGTSQPNAAFRVSGTGTTGVLDIGCNSSAPWIQSTDRTDLSQKYSLLLNPNGGSVGIGTTSPNSALQVNSGTNLGGILVGFNSGSSNFYDADLQVFRTGNGTERARIDSSGRLLVGTSSARTTANTSNVSQLQIEAAGTYAAQSISTNSNDGTGAYLSFVKSRGTTAGSSTLVSSGDAIGLISFDATDGTSPKTAAYILASVDATPGANDMPGRISFHTTADGASSPTERMRITRTGEIYVFCVSGAWNHTANNGSGAGTVSALYQGRYGATDNTGTTGTQSYVVWTNGNVQNTNNSYTAISDIKLKENIVDAGSQWADLKALRVRNYNLKEGQTHRQIGLIAQEVEPISPGLVYESPDRDAEGNDLGTVTKSVNYSVLYMKAVKALQEAMERIEALEQRLNDAGIN